MLFVSCARQEPPASEPKPEPDRPASSSIASSASSTSGSQSQPQSEPEDKPEYTVAAEPSFYPVSTESITVRITNISNAEGGYGLGHQLERNVDGAWEALPINVAVPSIWMFLFAEDSRVETFYLHHDMYDYQPGLYRIKFLDGLNGLSAEFTLE